MEEENWLVTQGREIKDGGAAGSSNDFPSGGGSNFASGGADHLGTNESSSMGDDAGEFSPGEPATKGIRVMSFAYIKEKKYYSIYLFI